METKEIGISHEMAIISKIHFNEFGYGSSGELAKIYLQKIKPKVEEIKNPVWRTDLLTVMKKIHKDCDYLLGYNSNLQDFKGKPRFGLVQNISRKIVILLSLGDMSHIHRGLSEQLLYFHSVVYDILLSNTSSLLPKTTGK